MTLQLSLAIPRRTSKMTQDDGRSMENDLWALSQKQLVQLAQAFGVPDINDTTDKPIIVRNILRGVGFKYTTVQSSSKFTTPKPQPRPVIQRPKTAELHDL